MPSDFRTRNACVTWNNPPLETRPLMFTELPDKVTYIVWSLECGKAGTTHWQIYVEFASTMTVAGIKKIFGEKSIHVEPRRGTAQQAADYCKKLDETHLQGPWEFGEISHQGQSSSARMEKEAQNGVIGELRRGKVRMADVPDDMVRSCPQAIKMAMTLAPPVLRKKVDVYYLEGDTGIGKTYGIFKMFPDAYRPTVSGDKVWFDGYDGQKTLLLDELRGGIKLGFLLQLLDPYPLKVEVKGGTVNAEWERVFITTNTPPEKWYPRISSEDPKTFEALLRRIGFRPLSPRYCVAGSREERNDFYKLCFPDLWVDDEAAPPQVDSNGSPILVDEEDE